MRSEYCTRCFLVIVINELGTRPAHRDERLPSLMAARRKVRSQHTHTAGTCFMESLSFPPAMSSGMFCCVSQPVRQTSCHPLARRTVPPERCSPASGQGVGPCPERQEQKHVLKAPPTPISPLESGGRCTWWHSAPQPQMSLSSGRDLPSCKGGGQGLSAHPAPLQSSLPVAARGVSKEQL